MDASPTDLELDALLRQYKAAHPHAVSPLMYSMDFGPEALCATLREANGREIVWSYPGQAQGVLDGCAYHYKDAVTNLGESKGRELT